MNQEPQATFTPTKSLLYWRKSKLNGAACVPVIVSLDASKTLSLKSADATEFSLPASEATVAFSNWGTMTITAGGKTYDIVGTGAAISPSPTTEQLQEINESGSSNASQNNTISTVGAAATAVSGMDNAVGAAGSVAMQYAYYKGLEAIKAWQQELPKAGVAVRASKMNAMKYFTVAIVALVVIFLVIGLAAKK